MYKNGFLEDIESISRINLEKLIMFTYSNGVGSTTGVHAAPCFNALLHFLLFLQFPLLASWTLQVPLVDTPSSVLSI